MTTSTDALRPARLTLATWSFLAASAFSSMGNGLTFPIGALYLERVLGLPLGVASLFFGTMAAAGGLASLAGGKAIDRGEPKKYVGGAVLTEALGLLAFALARDAWGVCAAGALIGAGNGLFFTGLTSLLATLESGETLDQVFAVRYWLINLGNGAGALIGGVLVGAVGERVLAPLYLANAASSVLLATVLLAPALLGARRRPPQSASAHGENRGSERLQWTSAQVAIVLAHGLVVLFGFALFESVIPYAFVHEHQASVSLAHVVVGASTIAIVALQIPIARWVRPWRKAKVLEAQAAVWAVAALLGLVAVGVAGQSLWCLAALYGACFGAGECLFAAGLQSLVVRSVPRAQLGRFNGIVAASYSAALAFGPALGFALLERVTPRAFWLAVASVMLVAGQVWSFVARQSAELQAT